MSDEREEQFDPRSEAAQKCGEFPYFTARPVSEVKSQGSWPSCVVGVFQHDADGKATQIGSYERNYTFLRTFWWFRRGTRHFALYSPQYTATRILEITPGVGFRDIGGEEPSGGGFCPVEFFVPDCRKQEFQEYSGPGSAIVDWTDPMASVPVGCEFHKDRQTHKATAKRRGFSWGEEKEYESGWIKFPTDHGFVAGCVWADDSSWKIQYLDLSRAEEGIIQRDHRFGYIELPSGILLRQAVRMFYPFEHSDDPGEVEIAIGTVWDVNTGRLKSPEIWAVDEHQKQDPSS